MTSELTVLKPQLVDKVTQLEREWATFEHEVGWPDPNTKPEALERAKAIRKKWGTEYKAVKESRLEITRKFDALKAELIAEENKLNEGAEGTYAYKFKQWEEHYLATQALVAYQKEQEAQKLIERAKAGATFKEGVSKVINDYMFDLKKALDLRLNTDEDMDALEADLSRPLVLLPEKYRELANTVAGPMLQKDPEVKDIIINANAGFREELMTMFRTQMQTFQRDLLTQIPARREQIAAGIKGEASTEALEAERKAAEAGIESKAKTEAQVAAIETAIEVGPATQAPKPVQEYDPKTVEDWHKLVAVAMGSPVEETGMDAEWFAKNMGKALTFANKKLKSGDSIAGVPVKNVFKVSRK